MSILKWLPVASEATFWYYGYCSLFLGWPTTEGQSNAGEFLYGVYQLKPAYIYICVLGLVGYLTGHGARMLCTKWFNKGIY